MSQILAPKGISLSPEATKAQAERINSALLAKEKECVAAVEAVLAEYGCLINPSVTITGLGFGDCGYSVVAKERLGMPPPQPSIVQ